MRRFLGICCLAVTVVVAGTMASAQSTRETSPPRLQLRATTADEPSVREAMQDEDVQAALRSHVRGIDMNRALREYGDAPLSDPQVGTSDDEVDRDFRLMTEGERRTLERRGTGPAPRDIRPERAPRPRSDTNIEPIPAEPVLVAPSHPHLDVERFATLLHALLQNNVNGYVMRMRRHGQLIYTLQWNWAQRPEDAGLGWNPDRRQHVASVSKFITAMGLTHLLDAQGISYDTPIIDYLPDYWQPGPNIEDITFADLMNHISGFGSGGSASSFSFMKLMVEQGVPANEVGNWATADYENMNFGLCRILMSTLAGYIDTDANFGGLNDVIWDWITIVAYADYINDNVFAPAGVSGPVLANAPDSARAYAWNDAGPGWDSGSMLSMTGGAAWHMSADEVLDVVGEFRRGGGIVSPERAQEILDLSYGLNSPLGGWPAPTGNFYFKPGRWWNGPPDNQAEQSLVMILPEDIEVVILVNSPLGAMDVQLQALGGVVYLESIVE